jgi:hypothetical protein
MVQNDRMDGREGGINVAHSYFEAERRAELTGKSFNRCLDEIYEEEMSARQTMEEAECQYYE